MISDAIGGVDLSFSSNDPIVLDAVTCSGSEEQLIDCGHAGLGVHYCYPSDGEAFVLCKGIWHMMVINSNIKLTFRIHTSCSKRVQ